MNDKQATATEPVRVQVDSVEKELSGLWRAAIGLRAPGTDTPVARVILSNLLVYSDDRAHADSIMGAIADVIADHPARVIVADTQLAHGEADVSIICSLSERGRRLCGEEIRLHTNGLGSEVLGSVMPMLAPDLPVKVLTLGDLVWKKDTLHSLIHVADSWIIDSRSFTSWRERFDLVECLRSERKPSVAVHDLAWVSLSGWRESVALHFDPPPARKCLPGISVIEIVFKSEDNARACIQAVLMAAWLMNGLSLEDPNVVKQPGNEWTIHTSLSGRDVPIRLLPSGVDHPVEAVVIECEIHGEPETIGASRAIFRSSRAANSDEIVVEGGVPEGAAHDQSWTRFP